MFGPVLGILIALGASPAAAALPGELRPYLREGVTAARAAAEPQGDALRALYESRDFAPLWFGAEGPNARAARVMDILRAAPELGLIPADYKLADLERLRRAADARGLAEYELALSRAAARLAADLAGGRVASVALPADVRIAPRAIDIAAVMRELARADDPARVFDALAPQDPAYAALLGALAELRAIKARGGWRNIDPRGGTLEPDAIDPRVPALRRRLAATDGAAAEPPDPANPEHYDPGLVEATKRFQRRHGLSVDGRVGPRSFAALNRTVDQRIAQVAVNLDRLRAQAPRQGTYIEVNVPAFELRAVENGEVKLEMAAIVGRAQRATPIFSTRVTEIIFNPPWTVPSKLVREDMLPRLRANPQALIDQGFRVYRGWGEERVEVDPRTVDWRKISPRAMPYTMRQDPGPKNALGEVRFTMPNTYDVFLHDTPDRHYFRRAERALSSGCVRVERPMDLVEWVLRNTPGWDREAIDAADAEPRTRHVPVRGAVPVHLVYRTAFVEDGVLQLRDDVYGIDALFLAGIEKRPVASLALPSEGAPAPVTLSP
ncbi:MAG: murein L,D-transpeptidase [Tagaea sp.]